jgi:hypothetical protein
MTVASNTPFDQYSATSGQTVFNYTFEIVEESDLLVYQRADGSDPDDAADLLTLTTEYTVTGVGNENGGTIVLVSGATTDDIITIKQNVPVERDTSFTPGGVLRAENLNIEYDNLTLIAQLTRFNEENRMLSYYNSAVVTPIVDTIIPVLGANQTWVKNAAGDEIIVADFPESGAAPKDETYIVQVADAGVPNAQAIGDLASGILIGTTTTGVILSRTLTGTTNQIGITNPTGIGGNPTFFISDNPILSGTAGMGIPRGTTAQRVTPIGYEGFRFNTDLNQMEYYDTILGDWTQLEDSGDFQNLIDRLAAHTAGDGASMIGLENQSGVTDKTVQDLANATLIAQTNNGTLTNGQFMADLDTGITKNTTGTGVQSVLTGSSAITAVINDDTMATAATTNLATALSIKNYVDAVAPSLNDGELMIGRTGDTPVANTLTAGSGISIAEAPGSITISGIASSIGWTEVTGTTQAMSADSGYISNNVATVVFTLPTTAEVGTLLQVVGKGAGGWKIEQNADQQIHVGNASTTAGTGGSVASTHQRDAISLVCTTEDLEWTAQAGIQGIVDII